VKVNPAVQAVHQPLAVQGLRQHQDRIPHATRTSIPSRTISRSKPSSLKNASGIFER
jgi:hypothetical protein